MSAPSSYTTAGTKLDHRPAAEVIRRAIAETGLDPLMVITLGSGLGPLADEIKNPHVIPYDQLPNFPQPTVAGHAGRLVLGTLDGVPVITMQGRMHYYEGHDIAELAVPIRAFKDAGVDILALTNASGSTREYNPPGSLVAINDHINLMAPNALIGPNDESIGPRFFDVSEAYDRKLLAHLLAAQEACGLPQTQGIYMWFTGPSFETPAEIKLAQLLGADTVGMSTVPETIAARHCGMRVACLSSVTNFAAGISPHPLSHEETLAVANKNAANLIRVMKAFVARVAADNQA